MLCNKCGKEINSESKFCEFCGKEIKQQELFSINSEQKISNKINWKDVLFNKRTLIIVAVIGFFIWIFSSDSNYNESKKLPLPAPIEEKYSDNIIEDSSNVPAVSLANGTILKKNVLYFQEEGKLDIDNGTNLDTVAKLIINGTSVFTVYIKANSSYTITGISDGIYWLAFAQGLNWDSVNKVFTEKNQYSAFEETFDFVTTEDDWYIYYPEFEVTLHPVVGGTAETSSVNPSQFNAY